MKLSQILLQKKQKDPVGLRNAQKNGSMAEYLRDDLLANGINPESLNFGGNPDLNVGGAQSITRNLKAGLKDESKPMEIIKQSIDHAHEVIAPKCPACSKNVYKMDEILYMEKEWHKDCFICGLKDNEIGCKTLLKKGEYQTHMQIPYCTACFIHNFQLGAARGTVLRAEERPALLEAHETANPSIAQQVDTTQLTMKERIAALNAKGGK